MTDYTNRKLNKKKVAGAILILVLLVGMIVYAIVISINARKYSKAKNTINNSLNENIINDNTVETQAIPENKTSLENKVQEVPPQTIENPPSQEAPTTLRQFGNDVAFIGDSRTQAFIMYTGLSNIIDYTDIGLMVNTAITKEFVKTADGRKITILEDMKSKNINTIYIMLGVNELGWAYSNLFIQKYEELIDSIKAIKPECEIIIESIIPVTKAKSDIDPVYNNSKIIEYNQLIKEMTERKGIKFLDVSSVLINSDGNLPEDATTDGVHINKEYSMKWLDFLQRN